MPASRSLSLDQFIALNEEMAALARAGVPLHRGLLDLRRDLPGRLGAMAGDIGRRLEQGETLEAVIADESHRFPPLYRAVMLAGVRSGNLSAALEGLAATTRRTAEMRRVVAVAMLYPVFVLLTAVVLFALLAGRWAPVVAQAYRDWDVSGRNAMESVATLGEHGFLWAPWAPVIVVLLGAVWWWRSGRAARAQVSGRLSALAFAPTLARMSKAGRMASFADVLRLLIEHRVPLPEALSLAGEATGDRRLAASSKRMAEQIQRGGKAESPPGERTGFPPLLAWLLRGGAPEKQLVSALDHLSRAYRHQAHQMAQWLSLYLPLILTAAIGGTAVLIYGLTVLAPVFHLMRAMAAS
ncbi:MAG: type II secretion system F family protein [Planctomycetes bacterium]|nr:type II secretion system F family protein [Planctomycetota bacterium]